MLPSVNDTRSCALVCFTTGTFWPALYEGFKYIGRLGKVVGPKRRYRSRPIIVIVMLLSFGRR